MGSWYRIKLSPADIEFSKFIRLRDKCCCRCGRLGAGDLGITGLQASHFFSRRMKSTRFDELNVDSLCPGCHNAWEHDKKGEYKDFKIKQLGQKDFDLLELRARTPDKSVDERLIAAYYRKKIKEFE